VRDWGRWIFQRVRLWLLLKQTPYDDVATEFRHTGDPPWQAGFLFKAIAYYQTEVEITYMPDTARILSLRRYVSLLQQEEKRLNWVHNSAQATAQQQANADNTLRRITEKLHNAERELAGLEDKR
jgi:hypothetical protein